MAFSSLPRPGRAMAPEKQDTATDIELRDHAQRQPPGASGGPSARAAGRSAAGHPHQGGHGQAYLVRAGEYIQVIDVSGRQCTDFQCLSARKLDKGIDHALDSTVTRTLIGRSYPTPGLPSKAFDREFEPLVEIVQDTVGRHDAFATACNARYYDDMGYPGHVNCTDNFNARSRPTASPRARAGRRSTTSTTPTSITITSSISTSRGRGPATMC